MKQGTIELRCESAGLRMTDQRRVIARVLQEAIDHPDVEELYTRAIMFDPAISIATVYRTVKLFEEAGILEKLEFGDGRARYEDAEREHHDHLIDMQTGEVIEFVDKEIELLQDGAIGMYTPQLYMLPGFAQSHAADSTATQSMRHYGHLAADDGRQ